MGLIEDDIDVEVDDGDVDAEGVGVVIGILDAGLGRGGGCGGFVGILLFLEDDGSVVGLRASLVGGRLLGRRRIWRGRLRAGGQREKDGQGSEEQGRDRTVGADGHDLKLYSGWGVFGLFVRQLCLEASNL